MFMQNFFWIFCADFQGESGLGSPGFVYKRMVNGFIEKRIAQFPCLDPMKCSSWVFVCFSSKWVLSVSHSFVFRWIVRGRAELLTRRHCPLPHDKELWGVNSCPDSHSPPVNSHPDVTGRWETIMLYYSVRLDTLQNWMHAIYSTIQKLRVSKILYFLKRY